MISNKFIFFKSNKPYINQARSLITTNYAQKASKDVKWKGFGGSVPENVKEINASVKARFSPQRVRDATGARLSQPSAVFGSSAMGSQGAVGSSHINPGSIPVDKHVDVYDAHNSVSLSSAMQSNVPHPYDMQGKKGPAHYNMPGGHWGQDDKYISGDLHEHHCLNINKKGRGIVAKSLLLMPKSQRSFIPFNFIVPANPRSCHLNHFKGHSGFAGSRSYHRISPFIGCQELVACHHRFAFRQSDVSVRWNQTAPEGSATPEKEPEVDNIGKLKLALRDYGSTVIVFHVFISLLSLGFFYVAVSSGVDMSGLIDYLGMNMSSLTQESTPDDDTLTSITSSTPDEEDDTPKSGAKSIVAGVSTFVLAYAIHKVFAPARIGITLAVTPFVVRHLRRIGILQTPKAPKPAKAYRELKS